MKIPPRAEVMAAVREQEAAIRRTRVDQERERSVINLKMALLPAKERHFEFRGRKYGVPPIPWAVGARLSEAWDRFASLDPRTSRDEAVSCIEEVVALLWEIARPVKWTHRIPYRFRNPFRPATLSEVGECLGFFLLAMMSDNGVSPEALASRLQPTLPTPSSDSSEKPPPGLEATAIPSRGNTSRSFSAATDSRERKTRYGSQGPFVRGRRPVTTGRAGKARNGASSDGER